MGTRVLIIAGWYKARLVAIMDWYSRKVLAWRLSNTLEADFLRRGPEGGAGRIWPA